MAIRKSERDLFLIRGADLKDPGKGTLHFLRILRCAYGVPILIMTKSIFCLSPQNHTPDYDFWITACGKKKAREMRIVAGKTTTRFADAERISI